MTEPLHLYSPKDVARVREKLYNEQGGLDPILHQPIDIKGAVLDHSHTSQRVRGVLHRQTNSFEGVVQRAYNRYLAWMTDKELADVLESLAVYYRSDYSNNPIHPGWLKKSLVEFRKLSAGAQTKVLKNLGSTKVCSNKKEREKELKKLQKTNTFDSIMNEIWQHLEE